MMRTRKGRMAVLLVAGAMAAACSVERAQATTLKTGAAMVCHGRSMMISSLPDGRFRFGGAAMDSAQLVAAFRNVLPPRDEKLVMVRLDSRREAALGWIVAAIEANGGAGYEMDEACLGPTFSTRIGGR